MWLLPFSEGSGTGANVFFSGAIVLVCAWEQFDLTDEGSERERGELAFKVGRLRGSREPDLWELAVEGVRERTIYNG